MQEDNYVITQNLIDTFYNFAGGQLCPPAKLNNHLCQGSQCPRLTQASASPSHPKMLSATKQYQTLYNQRLDISDSLDRIEDQFIRSETPLLKKRMLDVYNKVAPKKVLDLTNILNNITYGPVKISSIPLIDNGYQRFGSALYYKYKGPCGLFETPVLFVTYKTTSGKITTRLYSLVIDYPDRPCGLDDVVPSYWLAGMSLIDFDADDVTAAHMQLLNFFADNKDIAEFGDIYGAIPEYYDIQEKLRTGVEYFWAASEAPIAPPSTSALVEELREVTENYSSYTVHDLAIADWELIQGVLQKAFVALQLSRPAI